MPEDIRLGCRHRRHHRRSHCCKCRCCHRRYCRLCCQRRRRRRLKNVGCQKFAVDNFTDFAASISQKCFFRQRGRLNKSRELVFVHSIFHLHIVVY